MNQQHTHEPIPVRTTTREYALKFFNDGKWWGVGFGTMVAILTLSKYLWVIGHPELLMTSIASAQNLFVWLLYVFIGLFALTIILAFPSIVFSLIISPFNLKRSNLAILTTRFCKVIWSGFVWLASNLGLSAFFPIPVWVTLTGAFILALIGSIWALSFTSLARKRYMQRAGIGHAALWRFSHEKGSLICIATLLWVTSLTGIFPAQNTLLAWRGPDHGWEAFQAIVYCFFSMLLSTLPVLAFHTMPGSPARRFIKAGIALGMVLFLTLLMLPAVLDLWVYSAANMLKLRDDRSLPYLVDPKDYPRSTFNNTLWQVKDTDSPDKAFSIEAFKLYGLGETLLLCPERYKKVPLRKISDFTDKCFTTSSAKVKILAPNLTEHSTLRPYTNSPNCVSAQSFTNAPMKITDRKSCMFHELL